MKTDIKAKVTPKNPNLIVLMAFALVSSIAIMFLSWYKYLPEAPDKITYDWRTANFSDPANGQRKDIAVVLVNDDSLAQYWSRSPIDRAMLAELIRAVDSAEPKAIGLDFIFDRPSEPAKQEALLKAIREVKTPIIIGATDRRSRGVRERAFKWQEDFIAQTGKKSGHLYFQHQKSKFSISDDIIRFIGEKSSEEPVRSSFAELLAQIEKPGAKPKSEYIAWQLKPEEGGKSLFPTVYVPEHAPVDGNGSGDTVLPQQFKSLLKDKIVLIGGDFIDRDRHLTPLSYFGQEKTPGVLIHAQIIAQLLDGRGVYELNKNLEYAAVFLLGLAGFYLAFRFNLKKYDFIMGIVGISLLIVAGVIAFSLTKTILPSTTLTLAWIFGVSGGHYYRSFFVTSKATP